MEHLARGSHGLTVAAQGLGRTGMSAFHRAAGVVNGDRHAPEPMGTLNG
ncbi:hypothetical protein ACIOJD_16795 [Streptomyces sp. NPDC088116]